MIQMFKKTKFLLAGLLLAGTLMFAYAQPAAALFENAKEDACAGANLQNTSPGNCGDAPAATLTSRIRDFINLFSIIIGIIAVIMIIVSGLRYITAAGDSNGIAAAKSTLIYAIVGLIVAALAQVIVRFVLSKTT